MQNRSSGQKEMDMKGGIFLVVEASGRAVELGPGRWL